LVIGEFGDVVDGDFEVFVVVVVVLVGVCGVKLIVKVGMCMLVEEVIIIGFIVVLDVICSVECDLCVVGLIIGELYFVVVEDSEVFVEVVFGELLLKC